MPELQRTLKLTDPAELASALRGNLEAWGLPGRQIAVLCCLVEHGEREEVNGYDTVECTIALETAARHCRCSPNTFSHGVSDLERPADGPPIVQVVRKSRPWTYLANLSRLQTYEPAGTVRKEDLAIFAAEPPAGDLQPSSGVFSDLQPSSGRPCNRGDHESKPREDRVPVKPCTGEAAGEDGCRRVKETEDRRLLRPWDRREGVTDAMLVRAVRRNDLRVIRRLWDVATREKGWITRSDMAALDFLTLCHHAATAAGITKSRMGVLVKGVKAFGDRGAINTGRCRQASEDWAEDVLTRAKRDPQLARRE